MTHKIPLVEHRPSEKKWCSQYVYLYIPSPARCKQCDGWQSLSLSCQSKCMHHIGWAKFILLLLFSCQEIPPNDEKNVHLVFIPTLILRHLIILFSFKTFPLNFDSLERSPNNFKRVVWWFSYRVGEQHLYSKSMNNKTHLIFLCP